ncbi:mast cell carboxypeptidase A-like [Ambystoma mexicanum]|uniref:mast cell carboxypeptidase A-like n=1 Tax=Ambystoma mexicanum TaxID=8296 RepID=UPI0037E8F683
MARLVLLCLTSLALAASATRRFDGEKVFRVNVQTDKDAEVLRNLSSVVMLDFWRPDSAHHIVPEMDVDFRVSAGQHATVQDLLEQKNMQYKILFHNLQEGIEKQFSKRRRFPLSAHSYTRYNNWNQIISWTKRIAEKNPKLVSRVEIGTTSEGGPMFLLKVGKLTSEKKAIFMDCGIHAREWISPAFCQWFLKEATNTYGKDKTMTNLLKEMTFYVLPVLNVDGYVFTWKKNRLWRKNRSKSPDSECFGTDLNRNFNIAWGTLGSSNNPCSEMYSGSAPESEKETKAVANFIRNHIHSIKAYLSFHSYSEMLLFPFSYKYDLAPNHEELNAVAKAAVEALSSVHGTNYTYGPSASTIYPTAGSSDDWAYEQGIKYSYTFELRDTGEYGFLLPEYLIKPTCEETMLAVKSIANHVLSSAT